MPKIYLNSKFQSENIEFFFFLEDLLDISLQSYKFLEKIYFAFLIADSMKIVKKSSWITQETWQCGRELDQILMQFSNGKMVIKSF